MLGSASIPVLDFWAALSGGRRPGFDNSVYLSERETADRNFALAYYMREKGVFPEGTDLHDVLDFYFQCCAIEMSAESFAVVAGHIGKRRSLSPDRRAWFFRFRRSSAAFR